ncbi:MAG: EF-hand domain-containing protein [Sphingomicrobium sp.]
MKTLYFGGAAAAAMLAAGAALAQPAPAPAAPQARMAQMHRMQMKTMTRDEVVTHVRDMFAKLDANRDGFVMKEEANAAHQRLAGDRRAKIAKRMAERGANGGAAFDRLDANKDGSISRQEFDAGRRLRQERRIAVMQQGGRPGMMRMHRIGMGLGRGLFDMADANKDGRVSLQEATAAALQHFDSADLNHDGKLTPEERRQAHQQLRGQRQPA